MLLWLLLPLSILLAGIAPAAISFAAGQAGFTVVLVILFNIIQPLGWRVGLYRVEDVAIGCAVSLVVGVLFWPRGAAAALRQALGEAYADSARYLAGAVEFGIGRCDTSVPARHAPIDEAARAAAAARRLDDTFRGYLAERGAKPVPLFEVTGLITGVVGLRLAADAVLDLWRGDDCQSPGERAAARRELLKASEAVTAWYEALAAGLVEGSDVPAPLGSRRVFRSAARGRGAPRPHKRRRHCQRRRRAHHLDGRSPRCRQEAAGPDLRTGPRGWRAAQPRSCLPIGTVGDRPVRHGSFAGGRPRSRLWSTGPTREVPDGGEVPSSIARHGSR